MKGYERIMNRMKMKIPNFTYAITDLSFNIRDYDEELNRFLGVVDDLRGQKLSTYMPAISKNEEDNFYRVQTILSGEYYLKQSRKIIGDEEMYFIFIIDYLMINEIEKQVSYLNHQQYLYNEMFNKLDDGIYITDEKGQTLFINDAFVNLSGLSRESLIGKKVQELKADAVLPNSCCEKVIETKQTVTTINNYYEGQKCLVTGSLIRDEHGEFKRTIAVIRDVSELDMLMKKVANEKTLSLAFTKNMDEIKGEMIRDEVIVNNNPMVKDIYQKAKKLADIDSTVLILGETGVGKDFLASYIHANSSTRKKEKMIKINCAAIPEHLIESELFGYENGAFTGAQKGGKKGLFEEAGRGTIFLDEIGDMPYTMQVKLLNALNDLKFYRIGGAKEIKLKARIIAATNANIKELVQEKKFRADLYYRLNVINLTIPPLKERKEDIIPLAQSFLEYYNNKHRKNCFFSPKCLQHFLVYPWNGNVREMKNLIERLTIMSEEVCIDDKMFIEHLGQDVSMMVFNIDTMEQMNEMTLKERMDLYEKNLLEDLISKNFTMKEMAKQLGIDVSTLVRKKQKHGI
jgi:PAS domain S-box-containing protein